MKGKKIAIACQGGGSQTAFTAGVLKTLLADAIAHDTRIVSFSGTSGGAICATLAWYSLKKAARGDKTPPAQPLVAFWQDNATQCLHEDLLNLMLVGSLRFMESGLWPQWASSPSALHTGGVWPALTAMLPHQNFYSLRKLLETHIDFEEMADWDCGEGPALLIGAADVLKGDFKKFSSRKGEIQVEALLASAAVPTLFPAVHIGGSAYWDGLFSDNPPTDELLDEALVGPENLPDELWVIQINPEERAAVPVSPGDISDRRNEMIGNQSLHQDLQKIEMINKLLAAGAFTPAYQAKYRPVRLRFIRMSDALQAKLDYATKLDRSRSFIDQLMRDGETQAQHFLQELRRGGD